MTRNGKNEKKKKKRRAKREKEQEKEGDTIPQRSPLLLPSCPINHRAAKSSRIISGRLTPTATVAMREEPCNDQHPSAVCSENFDARQRAMENYSTAISSTLLHELINCNSETIWHESYSTETFNNLQRLIPLQLISYITQILQRLTCVKITTNTSY